MSKFLNSILKQKQTIFFAVFVLITLVGIALPQISHADWNPLCWEWIWGKDKPGTFWFDYCYYSGENNQAVLDALGDPLKTAFSALILAVATIIIAITGALATLASSLVLTIISASGSTCYTCFDNPAIAAGWPMVRDLANMFVVLGFVIIGIATILRIREYEAKKLLPKLIIAALLINFSLLISGIFIDGSNIAMNQFLKGGGYLSRSAVGNVANQTSAIWQKWNANQASDAVGTAVGIAFYNIILIIVFLLFFFLFLFRYIALWILVILSPLAFVCYVFPFTQNFFQKWWNNFLGWCIIGIPAGLFMFISDKIASNLLIVGAGSGIGVESLGYLVPATFLIAGFLISIQTSAMGAGAAIGAFKWTGDKLTGAGAWGGKKFADKIGLTRAATGAKDMATGALERMGLMQPGRTRMNQQARINEKDRQARVNAMTTEQMISELEHPRFGNSARYDRAAIVNRLAKEGISGTVNTAAWNREVNSAIGLGVSAGDLAKSNPDLARRDTARVNQIIAERGLSPADAENVAVREAYSRYKPEGLNQMNNVELANAVSTTSNVALRSKYLEQLTDNGGLSELSKLGITETQIAGHIQTAEQIYGSKVRDAAEKSMPGIRRHNVSAVNDIITARGWSNTNPAHISAAQDIAAVEGYTRLKVPQRRDLAPPAITHDAMTGSVEGTLEAARHMSAAQRKKYRDLCDISDPANSAAITAREAQLRALGLDQEADNLMAHVTDPRMAVL